MSNSNEQVESLKWRYSTLKHQTNNFRWNFLEASDDDVFEIFLVSEDTIEGFASIILKLIDPKHRIRLRREITYLVALRHRQIEAWHNKLAEFESQSKRLDKWLLNRDQ